MAEAMSGGLPPELLEQLVRLNAEAQALKAVVGLLLAQSARGADADGTVQRLGVYAASAHCRPEPGDGSNSWPKPEPSAPL